jgi:L-alanine-DL-glutamate epimerase-like enolase superfamily enzyme
VRGRSERHSLALDVPFTISRRSQETAEVVVAELEDEGGMVGVGAAAPASYYGETPETVEAVLPSLLGAAESVGDPHALAAVERAMRETVEGNPAARAAVEVAQQDLAAKRLGVPLYRLWGLEADRTPQTSFTIGLAETETMGERAAEAIEAGHDVLKVKLGTGRDEAVVAAVREAAPDATVRVDANGAWTPREAVRAARRFDDYGVEFVEQPVAADDPEGLRFVYEKSPLPVAADESCVTAADVPAVADRADVVVVKLMKCGGLAAARRQIAAAHAHGLEVMVGCMVESNASIAAACHLAPLVEYVDLDGALLLGEDPYDGVAFDGGEVRLDALDRPGTGARPADGD